MERTSVALLSELLTGLFDPAELDMFLASHAALRKARGASGPGVAPSQAIFLTAEALIRLGLAPEPLVPLLRERFEHQHEKIDAFRCAFLVQETADHLARLGSDRLREWSREEAPGPLERRLNGKTKDAATIAAQLPALPPKEREEALCSLRALWADHSVEAVTFDQLRHHWGMVKERARPPTPPPPADLARDEDEDDDDDARVLPNDLHHFTITLDRTVVWSRLLAHCDEPSHQLLIVRGDPHQSLQLFRARVQRYLSNHERPHDVRAFGPGNDYQPATTASAWEGLLVGSLGPAHYSIKKAIREATSHRPVLCMVGLNTPLHLGDDSLHQDDLNALAAFVRALPERLPPLQPQAPRPLRLLMPVQVNPLLGRLDPVFRTIQEATQSAERAAKTYTPPVPLTAALIGTLDTPTFGEIEEPIETRAWRRHQRHLSDAEWVTIQSAYESAVAARLPFVGLAEALWRALPVWMKDSP